MERSFDVYLVLHPFRDNAREFQILVRPLADLDAACLAGAEGFYRPSIDTALVALRFSEEAIARIGERMALGVASRCGLPLIVPDRLSHEERRHFFLTHLSHYSTYLQLYQSAHEHAGLAERVIGALTEHLAALPHAPPRPFAPDAELPLHDVTARRPRRLSSCGA
jgi:hypothetical protein